MLEHRPYASWPRLGFALLLAVVAVVSLRRSWTLKYDFNHFYLDAAYVWKHGALNPALGGEQPERQRQLPFYLPAVPLLLAPLAAGGRALAAPLWTLAQLVALAYSLIRLTRWASPAPARGPPGAIVAGACVLALPAIFEVARFNQLSFVILALVVGGLAALEQDKPRRAGVLLGLAALLKLLPAVFAVWLVLKRKWSALLVWVVTVLVVGLLPCLIVFGPRRTIEYHRQWWQYNTRRATGQAGAQPRLREHFVDYRNQSISDVLARLFWPDHPYPVPYQPAQLGRHTTRTIARGALLVLGVGLVWTTRRRAPPGDGVALRAEAATYALAMLVCSPLLRQYYLVWALPGLVLLARLAAEPAAGRLKTLGRIGLAVWIAGMLAWLSPTARAYGAHLVMLITLAAVLLRVARLGAGAGEQIGSNATADHAPTTR